MRRYQDYMQTPIGTLLVVASDEGVTRVDFVDQAPEMCDPNALVEQTLAQLAEYFAGRRKVFDVPLAAEGTEFRRRVWLELSQIPYGTTVCYGDIAERMNNPKAVRAVGAANGANPIAVIVPCHRVIGKNGTLTGYAGGLNRKDWLLKLEAGEAG